MITRREFASSALAFVESASSDPDRPRYHFLPRANWMNDPNAPIWHDGKYHMFYQYNPKAAKWDTMHWGHATTTDLLHWEHLPIALAPTPGGPDKDGCFSGCMVMDRGKPVIVYTGVDPQVQCLATSDDWITWTKHPRNPVIAGPPPGVDSPGFRDPHVWRDGNEWLMLVGAGFRGVGGTALLYKSSNLVEWTYLKPFMRGAINPKAKGGDVARGEMWECPDFFPVGDKWLFYVATEDKVKYWLGQWKDRMFTPQSEGVLTHGAGYAPKSSNASKGRRFIWAWLREQRGAAEQLKAGWSGTMSLAVVPSLAKDGTLLLDPAAEYDLIRGPKTADAAPLNDGTKLRIRLKQDQPFSLSRGGRELISYDPGTRILTAGRSEAPAPAGELELLVFLDGSVIELFANRKVWLTGRVYGPIEPLRTYGAYRSLESWPVNP
ncbi:MAG TPA: glycoside hydrolase family 32 protein [Paludibaculum sp.]|jgi:beta-fructofuranosidase